jgi:putative membrane protein
MSTNATPSDPGGGAAAGERLHPSSLLFSLGSAARRLLIPGIVVLLASGGQRFEAVLMIFFIPAALAALGRYLTYRYRLGDDELVIREGIVTRNERNIPYARIQNIDLRQNPLHRMLGVAEARLETAGGEKPEAVIRVLSLEAVERMRAHVFTRRESGGAEPAEAPPRAVVALPTRELMLHGLLSNRGLALLAAAFGAFWQFASYRMESQLEQVARQAGEALESVDLPGPWATALLAVAAATTLFVVLKLLSAAWFVIKYHGFTLVRRGDDLRAEYGLLTRISATVPRHRIQVLSTHSGMLQRRLKRISVQVETAGGREGEGRPGGGRLWLAPTLPEEQLPELLAQVLPEVEPESVSWQGLAPRAEGRVLRRGLILGTLAVGAAVVPLGPWALTALVPVALLATLNARLFVRHTRYALADRAVLYRSGWLRRRTSVVRFTKIQALDLSRNPFDRRAGMARLSVDTAGAGRIGHPVEIPYIGLEKAQALHDRLFEEAGRTAFRW